MEAMFAEVQPRVPFPPRPRAWNQLVDRIVAGAANATSAIAWQPVRIEGLDHPWIGVQAATLDTERAWQWDVVTPDDHEHDPLLRHDRLALAVAQDTMVVDVRRHDQPNVHIRLNVPVSRMPHSIDVSAHALPPPPWCLELATGWSAPSIAGGINHWLDEHVGHHVEVAGGAAGRGDSSSDDRFSIGDDLLATDDAFDELLRLGPADAAHITRAFLAIREALEPFR